MMPRPYPSGAGWIEVITGCMFSGKTEELLRRLERARIARLPVVVIKPRVDTRYAEDEVVSHGRARIRCVPVANAGEVLDQVGDAKVVGIDEAQFFDEGLVDVVETLAGDGLRVIVAGLDLDFRGRPFEPMPALMARAEYVDKMLAVCTVCGAPASRSQRMVGRGDRVLLGAQDHYEARCRRHWDPGLFDAEQESLPLSLSSRPS